MLSVVQLIDFNLENKHSSTTYVCFLPPVFNIKIARHGRMWQCAYQYFPWAWLEMFFMSFVSFF